MPHLKPNCFDTAYEIDDTPAWETFLFLKKKKSTDDKGMKNNLSCIEKSNVNATIHFSKNYACFNFKSVVCW